MRILYGVVGEGMGHAMRSRVVIEHLLRAEHEVEVVASQRAVDYLRRYFPEVHRIHGLHMVTEDNRVRMGSTLWSNMRDGAAAIPRQ
ncbi:MAG: glycosyltransferase family protein, partial [Polyangiales bacterium]